MPRLALTSQILVTGGAGFLGSHLCDRLLADDADVVCLDNFFTGSRSNIRHLLDHRSFELVRHDVTQPMHFEVDQIFNLACAASPVHYQAAPVQTTRSSVLGAMNVLELARRTRARVLQASTSEVYGDPDVHPQSESYWGRVNPVGPRACYDEGKRCAETLFMDYRRQLAMPVKIARIFNTYGPRMHPDDGRVISNFIRQALLGEPLTVYGDGGQTRCFCYVSDLVDGLVRLMSTEDDFTGPVNLGSAHEITIRELADRIVALTGSKSVIRNVQLPIDDPAQRQPDVTLARSRLGWQPTVSLDDGLAQTITYFDDLLSRGASGLHGGP
jgi:UDP-glucuronate decarboxylase